MSSLISFRLLSPLWSPLVTLQERYPVLKQVVRRSLWLLPSSSAHEMKWIIDTMDATSRTIFNQKKKAFRANDQELKIKMDEGKDLMSVLRRCFSAWINSAELIGSEVRANMMALEEDRLPEEELIAQVWCVSPRNHLTHSMS